MKKKQTEHQIDQDRSAIDQKFSSVLKETEIPDALKPENISSLIENNKPAEKSKVITNIHLPSLLCTALNYRYGDPPLCHPGQQGFQPALPGLCRNQLSVHHYYHENQRL